MQNPPKSIIVFPKFLTPPQNPLKSPVLQHLQHLSTILRGRAACPARLPGRRRARRRHRGGARRQPGGAAGGAEAQEGAQGGTKPQAAAESEV